MIYCKKITKGENTMYFKHKKLIQKICKGICTMAVFAAPVASGYCHVLFYQPKEPEGFKEFLKKEQKKI